MARLRFAPSPTGDIHIGTLRSALFNYIIAKKLNGKLILRIEDTDKKREIAGSIKNLLHTMKWAGIEFDEGPHIGGKFGPYTQSKRTKIYNKYSTELVKQGKAYYCFCSLERLDILKKEQAANKEAPRYDKHCKNLSQKEIEKKLETGESNVIRQIMPEKGEIRSLDRLRGEITFKVSDLEDHVLVKSDGTPTYQLANVIDDHLMKINLVVRGEEWIPSLPKNILLYEALGWQPPDFLHLPLMLNKNGGKLSKRQGDVSVENFRKKGYLKEAIINFCALQGWHPREEGKEIYSLDQIINKFEIADIGTSGAVFDAEKLDYLNGYYIRQLDVDTLTNYCLPHLKNNIKSTNNESKKSIDFIKKIVKLEQERLKKIVEIKDLTKFLFANSINYEPTLLLWKKMTKNDAEKSLQELITLLNIIPEESWNSNGIEEAIISHIRAKNGKIGYYLWPLRVSLTGKKASPSPFEIAEILGKKESLKRIEQGINALK